MAVSPDGSRVFVTGKSWAGPSPTAGTDYATVAYRASTGTQRWLRRYNGPGNGDDGASSIAVNRSGNRVFVTGSSYSRATTGDFATIAYSS